ncbi:hypothetical protein MZD04_gp291 [Pseudomonas phage Psa21]|uniref:Uncharacterized protein n=1 Tax=Pseudomonas phage Psa21 TaxID=2530023 RepID=A0A481W6H9_9CAUD|nr:hypothetical protein MZD04_gp291 [Pseudomonas phage Psa21]QBJ02817.1 hypothetical protein PSA21_291 [Pseudomonas phage Psa21]
MKQVVLIPVLDTGTNEQRKLFTDGTQIDAVHNCELLNAYLERFTDYFVVCDAIIPGVYQRTIYFKGPTASIQIGSLMVDLKTGLYTLKLSDPMARPAGLDIHLTVNTIPKESECRSKYPSEQCHSMKAVA